MLTARTPTVMAGDGSNLDVVAHELSHSWSGNLVTCAGWSHFWLNEGELNVVDPKVVLILNRMDRVPREEDYRENSW